LCVSNEPGVDEPNGAAGCLHMDRHIRVKIHAANAASARRSLRIRAGHGSYASWVLLLGTCRVFNGNIKYGDIVRYIGVI